MARKRHYENLSQFPGSQIDLPPTLLYEMENIFQNSVAYASVVPVGIAAQPPATMNIKHHSSTKAPGLWKKFAIAAPVVAALFTLTWHVWPKQHEASTATYIEIHSASFNLKMYHTSTVAH
jgi:hypothetical protein